MQDALDIEHPDVLLAYLRTTDRIPADESPTISILKGGVSNRTVLVEREKSEGWVLKQALPKLRVRVDWFSSPARIHQEALGLRWLRQLAPPGTIPALVFEDHERHLLAMEAVPRGHENWKAMLLAGRLERGHVEQFARLLGTVHRAAAERAGELAPVFADRSFFESLRLEPYYLYTARQVPEAARFLEALVDATLARRDTLVHGDYSPKNVLVYRDRLVLLDHEVIHWGDPGFDLGFGLTHLLSKAHHLPERRAAFAEAARLFWAVYRETAGDAPWAEDLEGRAVRHTLGCLLARVAGRSPLEYLTEPQRERQQDAAVGLMRQPPTRVWDLIDTFLERV